MASFTQNITNAVRCFGCGPSTKWGQALAYPNTMTWGTSKWGEGLSVLRTYQKVVSNTQSMTWAHTQVADFVRTISVAVVLPAFEMSSERLANGSTWNYVFNDNSNEAENRYFPTYSTPTAADATFTCQAAASTVWS